MYWVYVEMARPTMSSTVCLHPIRKPFCRPFRTWKVRPAGKGLWLRGDIPHLLPTVWCPFHPPLMRRKSAPNAWPPLKRSNGHLAACHFSARLSSDPRPFH